MTYDGEVEPQITDITLNGSDACTGSSTTTSGPQTTTPETTTTTTIASSTTASTQGPVTGTTTKAPETTTSSGSTCSAERYDFGRVGVRRGAWEYHPNIEPLQISGISVQENNGGEYQEARDPVCE